MRPPRLRQAVEDIGDAIALLRFASAELPVVERHLFLQAVSALAVAAQRVEGLLEPVDA